MQILAQETIRGNTLGLEVRRRNILTPELLKVGSFHPGKAMF